VAHLIPLVVLPSGLWRLALAFGLSIRLPRLLPTR
jgi:hypothetical protein